MKYRVIKDFPAYEVSQCGLSVRRISNQKEVKQGFQMIQGKSSGYLYCTFTWDEDGNYLFPPKRVAVHRIVAKAWLFPPKSPGLVWVNHKDGNKANNNRDNLEWTTISQNIQHAYKTGLIVRPRGESHPRHGKKHTKQAKKAMSEAKSGTKHPMFKGYYFCNFKRFTSATQAAAFFDMQPHTVINRCKSGNDKWTKAGWYFLHIT